MLFGMFFYSSVQNELDQHEIQLLVLKLLSSLCLGEKGSELFGWRYMALILPADFSSGEAKFMDTVG